MADLKIGCTEARTAAEGRPYKREFVWSWGPARRR